MFIRYYPSFDLDSVELRFSGPGAFFGVTSLQVESRPLTSASKLFDSKAKDLFLIFATFINESE